MDDVGMGHVSIVALPADHGILGRESPTEKAVDALAGLTQTFPEEFEASFFRARGLLLLERRDEARRALKEALIRNPGFPPAEALLANLEGRSLDVGAGLSGGVKKGWREFWLEAYVASGRRDWKTAEAAYTTLIDLVRGDAKELYLGATAEFLLGRGLARLMAGSISKEKKVFLWTAQEDFVKARDRQPELLEPALLLAKTYCLLERYDMAELTLEDQYQGSPDARSSTASERLRSTRRPFALEPTASLA